MYVCINTHACIPCSHDDTYVYIHTRYACITGLPGCDYQGKCWLMFSDKVI